MWLGGGKLIKMHRRALPLTIDINTWHEMYTAGRGRGVLAKECQPANRHMKGSVLDMQQFMGSHPALNPSK
jgi:hypothetical protein